MSLTTLEMLVATPMVVSVLLAFWWAYNDGKEAIAEQLKVEEGRAKLESEYPEWFN